MKYLLTLLVLFLIQVSFGQVNDDFSDGDFTNNPTWSGNTGDFVVSANELQLNASAAGESHLTIPNATIDETIWEFSVQLDFGTSSQNRAYIYLVSNIDDLQGNVNGYYVLVGNTSDEISLYRQDATTTSVEIIDGTDATVGTPPTNVRIRVTRDDLGNWELLRDLTGGTSFTSEGTVFDDTYTSSAYFGILCDYSAGNIEGFTFDDISIGFAVSTLTLEGTNMIRAKFNQDVHESTAEEVSNYSLDNGYGNPISAERDLTNHDEVTIKCQ